MTELEAYLREIADKTAGCDDNEFVVDDYAGGNVDDAYGVGVGDGEILFARNLLEQFYSE